MGVAVQRDARGGDGVKDARDGEGEGWSQEVVANSNGEADVACNLAIFARLRFLRLSIAAYVQ